MCVKSESLGLLLMLLGQTPLHTNNRSVDWPVIAVVTGEFHSIHTLRNIYVCIQMETRIVLELRISLVNP